MRVTDAARIIGVSADFIRRLDREGHIHLPRDINGHRRIAAAELEALRRVIFPTKDAATHPASPRRGRG